MPSYRIRTILVEDSAFMRKLIGDIIRQDDTIELVGIARNGQEGTEMALTLKPDVIVTDMVMPDYDGLHLVNEVMTRQPAPIILLSALEKTDNRIFDALKNGAFDFIDKPSDYHNPGNDYQLLRLIREASATDISVLKARQLARRNVHQHTFSEKLNYEIIVIGASTGGPGAVEMIINNLPANLKVPVVIVQHMPHRFLESFVQRLNENAPLPVQLPRKGEPVRNGVIYFAPGDANLKIDRNISNGQPMFIHTEKQYQEYNYPSIDCLFESVADTYGKTTLAVILTGMGKDGTTGMTKIRQRGGFTVGQDEKSCVVYGMPKAAFEAGAVQQVVSLSQIPGFIISSL